nr:alpha-N-acetylgalactosaminide alpha-2,6-sialyltransferase 6 isoform X5 [Loxodonta africana]XP_023400663.1 alpha-N-acetylgalactosaminide alpha-2,6-sialyltransferase 6 isoform X5 [Loxodonta africana]XP_023400664.1 alpha-N-acetylgalactosaminide alpha-2,6-sialyltransferase 6 isoform X5 [Loxodonta africana]
MSSKKEQRSVVFVILFALITILILYSSNSANEVFHYGSLRGRSRRPINLKKWSITDGYVPLLGNKTLPSRCHQCVIVTSSSHLLGTKLGPEIERAECTIRMNDAPTTGYAADVGNKTTFRVVAHSSVFRVLRRPQEFVNRTPETIFIFWGPPSKMQKPQGSLVRIIQRAGLVFPNMEAYAVSPARMQQFDDLFLGKLAWVQLLPAWSLVMVTSSLPSSDQFPSESSFLVRPAPSLSPRVALPTSLISAQGEVPFVVKHRLVHHGDCGGVV